MKEVLNSSNLGLNRYWKGTENDFQKYMGTLLREKHFSSEKVIAKYQKLKSRGVLTPAPLRRPRRKSHPK